MSKRVTEADAVLVLQRAAELLHLDAEDLRLYPAEHEGLPKGSWAIAYEGWSADTPWTYLVSDDQFTNPDKYPAVFLEPLTSWGLGVYPR